MSDDDGKSKRNLTLMGFRSISDGKEPTEEQKLALENHMRFMIGLRKFIEHMLQYWKQWVVFIISSAIGAEISGLINVVS